jgi:hypothetical protein
MPMSSTDLIIGLLTLMLIGSGIVSLVLPLV